MLVGAMGCHPAGVAGMRSPRGAACVTRLDASARAGGEGRQRAGVGWAEAKARAREDRWAGFG